MKKQIAYIVGAVVAILIVIVIVLILNNQKYVVTFDMQNGEPKFEQLVKKGNRVYEPSDPKNEGYIFLGWYRENELYDFTKVVKNNMTLVAKWEKDDYVKVSFETVGGNTIEPVSVKKGSKVTRPIDPKKTGHTFKEWTLNGKAFDFETPITEDITLLATYVDVYSVYFDSNGGSEVASGTVKGGKIAKPEDPTRKGYKFLGWYLDDKAYDFSTEVKDNMTLKAKWLLENAYIKSRTAADNEKLIGLDFTSRTELSSGKITLKFTYPINKIIVGATKPTKNVAKEADLSVDKDGSVKAYIVKSGTNYDLLIAAEDTRTIINLPSNSSNLFADLFADSITFNSNVNAKTITNMSGMFSLSAMTINLKNFDTSNVTNMKNVFAIDERFHNMTSGEIDYTYYTGKAGEKLTRFGSDCITINNLNSLNVSKVTNMTGMFYLGSYCDTLDLSSWNTSKVTSMASMFYDTNAKVNLKGLNTSKVIDMSDTFATFINDGVEMNAADLSSWNTANVTNMSNMFFLNHQVKNLDLSKWNTSKVTDMSGMFYDVTLNQLNLSNWNTSNVTDMASMFSGATINSVTGLNSFNTSKVTNMSFMFGSDTDSCGMTCSGSTKIDNLDISSWDTSNVTDMSYMFTYGKFKKMTLTNFKATKLTNAEAIFKGLTTEKLYIDNFDLTNVKTKDNAFADLQNYDKLYIQTNENMKNFITKNYPKYAGCFSMQ